MGKRRKADFHETSHDSFASPFSNPFHPFVFHFLPASFLPPTHSLCLAQVSFAETSQPDILEINFVRRVRKTRRRTRDPDSSRSKLLVRTENESEGVFRGNRLFPRVASREKRRDRYQTGRDDEITQDPGCGRQMSYSRALTLNLINLTAGIV